MSSNSLRKIIENNERRSVEGGKNTDYDFFFALLFVRMLRRMIGKKCSIVDISKSYISMSSTYLKELSAISHCFFFAVAFCTTLI